MSIMWQRDPDAGPGLQFHAPPTAQDTASRPERTHANASTAAVCVSVSPVVAPNILPLHSSIFGSP